MLRLTDAQIASRVPLTAEHRAYITNEINRTHRGHAYWNDEYFPITCSGGSSLWYDERRDKRAPSRNFKPIPDETKSAVGRRANWMCEQCGKKSMHFHHISYERVGKEEPDDLLYLCRHCHENIHHDRYDVFWLYEADKLDHWRVNEQLAAWGILNLYQAPRGWRKPLRY